MQVELSWSWSYGNWIDNDRSVVFSRYSNFPQPIKLTATYIAEILLKVVFKHHKKTISGESCSIRRKPSTCHKSLTNNQIHLVTGGNQTVVMIGTDCIDRCQLIKIYINQLPCNCGNNNLYWSTEFWLARTTSIWNLVKIQTLRHNIKLILIQQKLWVQLNCRLGLVLHSTYTTEIIQQKLWVQLNCRLGLVLLSGFLGMGYSHCWTPYFDCEI